MSNKKAVKQTGGLVAIIADEGLVVFIVCSFVHPHNIHVVLDTVTGFLLAGNIVELRLPFPPQCFLLCRGWKRGRKEEVQFFSRGLE